MKRIIKYYIKYHNVIVRSVIVEFLTPVSIMTDYFISASIKRLNRLLSIGNRKRGDVLIEF